MRRSQLGTSLRQCLLDLLAYHCINREQAWKWENPNLPQKGFPSYIKGFSIRNAFR